MRDQDVDAIVARSINSTPRPASTTNASTPSRRWRDRLIAGNDETLEAFVVEFPKPTASICAG